MKSQDVSLSTYGHLIEEAKDIVRCFVVCSFSHIKRYGNFAAHHITC